MPKKIKKLYRSKSQRVIAGICGGMAEYSDIDPTLVRVLWIIGTCIFGAGILAYLILWLIIPEK